MGGITDAEILEAIRLAIAPAGEDAEPGTFTTRQLAEAMKCSQNWAQEVVRGLSRKGKVYFVGKRSDVTVDGRSCRVPAYRLAA